MFIKTKKRGEIEVGGDEEISKALSSAFGPILDEMYDLIVEETTLTMWPDDDLTICISVGGDNADENDLKTVTLGQLIKDAASGADKQEKTAMKNKLREIANLL
jgi:hypothetical protein